MKLLLAFLLGILVAHLWNNPDVVEQWKTEAESRWQMIQTAVHAATEQTP